MRLNSLTLLIGLSLAGTLPPALAAEVSTPPAVPTPTQASTPGQDTSRIVRMTLSSGGVAEVHRVVDLQGAGPIRIDVPLAQVDDVLKSLLVSDPGGAVHGISLDGLSPVAETFSTLPVDAKSIGSLPALLPRLKGVAVRVSAGGRTIEGAVLGLETLRVNTGAGEPATEHRLSVLTADKRIEVLRIGADATLEILDDSLRERLATAVQALGQAGSDTMRTIAVDVEGGGTRSVQLSYITAAPIWKPAFRMVITDGGRARLQGWAVLENATGRDWNDVDLTLASGAPVTFTQKLHDRYWRTRPELPVAVGVGETPRVDRSAAAPMARPSPQTARARSSAMAEAADMTVEPAMAPPPAPAPMATPSAPAQSALAQEGVTNVRFHLRQPVSLARGQTLSVPFVDIDLPAQRLSVFQPETGARHPVSAVMLENTSPATLPPGILTVYEAETGFVGDAAMPALPAGESRLASFASDSKVEVSFEAKPEQRITAIRVSEGMARLQTLERRVTTYRIQGAADAPRTLIIEHPKEAGWKARSALLDSETATHYRLRVQVPAKATLQAEVADELPGTDSFALTETDEAMLMVLANAPSTPELQSQLKALAQQRRAWAAAERQVAAIDARIDVQVSDQSRLRDNLGAVPSDSELGRRYMDLLAKSENQIASLTKQRDQASANEEKLKEAFLAAIAKL